LHISRLSASGRLQLPSHVPLYVAATIVAATLEEQALGW
jgi:hypothetical protein